MQIPLNQFEQLIDKTILKRGLSYFKNNAVTNLSEISNGEYEVIASGTENYTVCLKIKNSVITEHQCDCPYDMGAVCKHIVAAIFYLLQDELSLDTISSSKSKGKKKSPSVHQQVKRLLSKISSEDLSAFIVEYSKKDKNFRNFFMASFSHLIEENKSKDFYQKQIQSILKTAKGRDGWIDWVGIKQVSKTVQPFIDNAEKSLEQKDYETVFYIATSIVEEMTKAIQYTDDSNGELGYLINTSMGFIFKLIEEPISPTLRQELYNYGISTFQQGLFKGWGWHLEILKVAANLANNETEVNTILQTLDKVQEEYDKKQAQRYQLELLRKHKSQKEVDTFIQKNITNPDIRIQEIQKAIEDKEFDKAKQLAKDGIAYDEKDSPGHAIQWYDWLLAIALAQEDTPKIIQYARYRLIDNFRAKYDYYQLLKNTIAPENWKTFLEEIIQEVSTTKDRWRSAQLIEKIYINEQWWDRLFVLLKQCISLERIKNYEEYLAEDYAQELIQLYKKQLLPYVDGFMGREHYQKACQYLRRMKKLGGEEQVEELITFFKTKYSNRRALLDELSKL